MINKSLHCVIFLLLLILAVACGGMKVEQFEEAKREFVLEEYFLGKTRAWGVVHDRNGKLRRQFTVDIVGEKQGDELVLTEDFLYADGETDQRIWRITKLNEHQYEGRAADVIGVAKGESYGNALHWNYYLDLKLDDDTLKVHFDDWMYLQPDDVLINRAVMSKWGVELAEVVIFFRRMS